MDNLIQLQIVISRDTWSDELDDHDRLKFYVNNQKGKCIYYTWIPYCEMSPSEKKQIIDNIVSGTIDKINRSYASMSNIHGVEIKPPTIRFTTMNGDTIEV
jgi:hypothetical protein